VSAGRYDLLIELNLTCRVGVYADASGVPAALLWESGSLNIPSTVQFTPVEVTISPALVLTKGRYWFGWVKQTANALTMNVMNQFGSVRQGVKFTTPTSPANILGSASGFECWFQNSVSGALPNPCSPTGLANYAPMMAFRVAP